MNLNITALAAAALLCCPTLAAQDATTHRSQDDSKALSNEIVRLDVEARVDYDFVDNDKITNDQKTGFFGKYLVMRIDGVITPGLTYSWRQRFNKNMANFNATDWVYLNYAVDRWNFQVGKEVVAIGGYEYDRAPIDLYGTSVFWNNIPCYAFGVSAAYNITGNDRLLFQVARGSFATDANNNMYSYNLMWNGSHGIYSTIWSLNLQEYARDKYINYIALGNRFDFNKVALELDVMNRAASHQRFLFKDCSVMAELSYRPTDRWKIYGKYTYDKNTTGTNADMTVLNGTKLSMAGAGAEYYPLQKDRNRLRVHAGVFHSWGHNANSNDLMQYNTTYVNVGVTWDMQLLNIRRK